MNRTIHKLAQKIENKFRVKILKDVGYTDLFGKKFHFHYRSAFYVTYDEIFRKEIYSFYTSGKSPLIIDCGSNMGLSLLYFSIKFPESQIYGFEPDTSVLTCLEKNIETYNLKNVELVKKAVWVRNETLEFFTDNGMGGRLGIDYSDQIPVKVEAIRLKEFIGDKHIDFLKMDIEGAEYDVISDCEPILNQIDKIFIEYHSILNEEQKLDELLNILKRNGFRYHISQSFSRRRPFIDNTVTCERIDLAVNVFGYKS